VDELMIFQKEFYDHDSIYDQAGGYMQAEHNTHEWMGIYNGTKQVFFPCRLDETICNIYLQGEMQGYDDSTEQNPSYINLISRICLGTSDFCNWLYTNHWWYNNLDVEK
jgi:hypothetical protein